MIIKSKHLKISDVRPLEDQLVASGYEWDKSVDHYGYAVGSESHANSPALYKDGFMIIPGTGKAEVPSIVYLDYEETMIFDKSPEVEEHFDEVPS